jgi:tripartite-type tricarboxylate transporter receptor subunit TctC
MLTRRQILKSTAGAALASPFVTTSGFAQEAWPAKEVRAIAMFPAGSGADIYVRFFAKKLGDEIGKTVIVENKPGAFGNIANEYVARAKPDGYTIYIAPTNLLTIAPALYRKLNYDPLKDYDSACTLFKLPFMLTVSGKSSYKNVADLVADMKKKGSKGNYGSVSTVSLISAELFKQQFGLETVEVKYKESAAAMNDLIGGNLDFVFIDPAGSAANRTSGAMRALAVTTKDRVSSLPDIPGAHEAGIMNSDVFSWWSIHTPKGTPKAILDRLEVAGLKIVKDADTKDFLSKTGSDPFPGDAALARKLLEEGVKTWGDWVKLAKVEQMG